MQNVNAKPATDALRASRLLSDAQALSSRFNTIAKPVERRRTAHQRQPWRAWPIRSTNWPRRSRSLNQKISVRFPTAGGQPNDLLDSA
jgi:flagellar hook-associated protein FlgK